MMRTGHASTFSMFGLRLIILADILGLVVGTACTTKYQQYKGECMSTSLCEGATFSGYCPGSSDIKCCVETPAKYAHLAGSPTSNPQLSFDDFTAIFAGISGKRARMMYDGFVASLQDENILKEDCFEVAAFAAQVAHESGSLKYFEEYGNYCTNYEWRSSLGNNREGDGCRFKEGGLFN